MNEQKQAKELVIRAGRELVRSGLIARTWGNVSCRVDGGSFAVTPSGRLYETLTPADIVLCKAADASYEGDVRPSTEKGVHALVYRLYPDAGFVIHTHQPAASAVGAAAIHKMPPLGRELLGEGVPVAAYGLPGTKKLRNGVAAALRESSGRAVLMAHHGALCFGRDYEEAFAAVRQLEEACVEFLRRTYKEKSGAPAYDEQAFYRYGAAIGSAPEEQSPVFLGCSRRTEEGFVLEGERETVCRFGDTDLSQAAQIHQGIYRKRKDVRFIRQDTDDGLLELSRARAPLLPWLDDFAQMAGESADCAADTRPDTVARALGNRMGVLVPNGGALCCAASGTDAYALGLVLKKDVLAQMSARLLGGRPVGPVDCRYMRFFYTQKYSKRARN